MEVAEKHHTDRNGPRRAFGRRLAAPALLVLLIAGFYWKLLFTDEFIWLDSPDLANQVLPWFQFQAGEWHRGRLPLWDPYQWAGQPLVGQVQPGAAYPLNWILFSLPLRNGWLRMDFLNWYFVALHLIAGLLAYWFCRDRGLPPVAGVFGGLAYALGGWLGNTDWPQMLNGAIWAPAVFLFLMRMAEGRRPWASSLLAGFFLGLSWLSGHHQVPIFLSLAALAVSGYAVWKAGSERLKRTGMVAVFLFNCALTAGLQVLPAWEYGRLALRWAGGPEPTRWNGKVPYWVHQDLSLPPSAPLAIILPLRDLKVNPFQGLTVGLLALLGAVHGWHRAGTRLWVFLGLASLLTAIGPYSPIHGVLYSLVPLVEKARAPAVSVFILNFSLSYLSACGIYSLCTRGSRSSWLLAERILLGLGVLIAAVCLVFQYAMKMPPGELLWLSAVAAIALAGLLVAWRREAIGSWALGVGLMIMALTELTSNGMVASLPSRYAKVRPGVIDPLSRFDDVVNYLRHMPRPFRVNMEPQDVPFNLGDWHGVETISGYLASLTTNVFQAGLHKEEVQRLVGARFHVARKPIREGVKLVFQGRDGLNVYEDESALPRAWVSHVAIKLNSKDEIQSFITKNKDALSETVPMESDPPGVQRCQDAELPRVLDSVPGRTTLSANLGCRGMVIISEPYYPGWHALVDGEEVPIYETFGFMKGIAVEAGSHRIELFYRPLSVGFGVLMTATGILLAVGSVFFSGRRRPARG